jgi:hypothetical protein
VQDEPAGQTGPVPATAHPRAPRQADDLYVGPGLATTGACPSADPCAFDYALKLNAIGKKLPATQSPPKARLTVTLGGTTGSTKEVTIRTPRKRK